MTKTPPVRYGLLRHHGTMLKTGGQVALHTLMYALRRAMSATRPASVHTPATVIAPTISPTIAPTIAPVRRTVAAPPAQLVDEYIAWAGAAGRYADDLPPHMVSQWSLPLVGELLLQMPYKLTGVINQGVTLRVHGPLPRDTPLLVTAAVEQIENIAGRIKVVVAVVTGTAQHAALVEARLHMSFLLPGPRAPKAVSERPAEPQWATAGLWQADARDGLRFALLTGDFNPIHWCAPLARRSVFGGMVLHGFGSFVRSYELLEAGSFSEIDVRFVKPVPLPCSMLSVQVAPADALADAAGANGWRALRLAGGGDSVHLAGRIR
jgi:acyl dehydratase